MDPISHALEQYKAQLSSARCIWVGYSGGLDSSVLLHALLAMQLPVPVKALHINHQLSPNAQHWQTHCERVAALWQCSIVTCTVQVREQGKGLEAAARSARYSAFDSVLSSDDILLTAHHAEDQAETLLLRMVRGAGLKGLAAIKRKGWLPNAANNKCLLRPLLDVPLIAFKRYAEANRLQWIEDESNRDERFNRNFLRHQLLPLLAQRWPNASMKIGETANLLAEADDLLEAYLQQDLAACDPRHERLGVSLDLTQLGEFPWPKQKHILRYWLLAEGYPVPSRQQFVELEKLLNASADANPEVCWGSGLSNPSERQGVSVRRYQQRLYLLSRVSIEQPSSCLDWNTSSSLRLGVFELSAAPSASRMGLPSGQYQVRFRQGGERCKPAGRAHSQSLKKLLQAYNLEPWLRDSVPLIYSGDELVAVGDLWICAGWQKLGGLQVRWRTVSSE